MRHARGATLIELAVALAILGLLSTVLYGGLRFVGGAGATLENATRTALDLQLAERFVSDRLEAARPTGFSGMPDAVRFLAPSPPQLGSGGVYAFSIEVRRSGAEMALVMTQQLLQAPTWTRFDSAPPVPLTIVGGLQGAGFEYQSPRQGAWSTSWDVQDGLPGLVRLNLRVSGRVHALVVAPKLLTARPPGVS